MVAALSTVYPERVGAEFVLSLPDWEKHWSQDHPFQPAFAESFKWRQIDAFNDDTRTLLNSLDSGYVEPLGLLLEVSMTSSHPYNAHRLHNHLKRFPLAERDSYWTQWINYSSREELSQIDRIVSWSLSTADENSNPQHVELAAIVLAWSLAKELGLVSRSEDFRSWMRESGEEVFRVFRSGEDHQSGVVIDASVFNEYLAVHELDAVWLFIAERNAWPNGDNEQARRPRFEAAIWRDGKSWKSLNWVRDT